MAIESWIDALAKRWEITDHRGKTLKSYRLFEKAEWPEALNEWPCALTFPIELVSTYTAGGPNVDLWKGRTEIHMFPDVGKHHYPDIVKTIARLRDAAAGQITLGGLVSYFLLATDEASILAPVVMVYGTEDPHLGIIVNWRVKELSDVTVAA